VTEALSFETTREAIAALPPASGDLDRVLVWVDDDHHLALSRDVRGRIEVFVVCEELVAASRELASALQHQTWTTASGDSLPANRLVLPAARHFDGVAAFICAELTANGIGTNPVTAFGRTEPAIALALRRAALSDQALVGLAGELYVLARLTGALPSLSEPIIEGWYGSGPSTRDLQIGTVGVEIKTTSGPMSTHHIQGLHQVQLGFGIGDAPETHLFLLSLGVVWLASASGAGRTIPDLVDAVLASLPDSAVRDGFLARVRQYGGDAGIGYDHNEDRGASRYTQPFQMRFERLYDLGDEALHLLRSPDVAHAAHVQQDSISYRVQLPAQVRGDVNPIAGMPAIVEHLAAIL
jgi:hypothetical protein